MDRRDFLSSTSSLVLPASFFATSSARESVKPRRLVCIGLDLSLRPESFFPAQQGHEYELTPLLKFLSSWRNRMTVFSQLDHPGVVGGHAAVHAFLTGVRRDQRAGFAEGCISLDQAAAVQLGYLTRFPSLCFGTGGGDSISWTRSGVNLAKLDNPTKAWQMMFRQENARERAKKRALSREDLSVVSILEQESQKLKPRLDSWDREKLAEFTESLEQFEEKTKAEERWIDEPMPEASAPAPEWSEDNCIGRIRATLEIMALGLQADSSRVMTCNVGTSLPVAGQIPGVSRSYHDLSHSGQSPAKLKELFLVESAIVKELDRFLKRLDEMKDVDGTHLLDNTVVLFGSGMGNASSHSSRNLPVLIAGGGLAHGEHLFFEKNANGQTPLCDLYVTLLQWMGLERDSFGTSSGNLNELLG